MSETSENQPQGLMKNSRAGIWFLLLVCVIYVLIAFIDPDYARAGMMSFIEMLQALLPALLVVFVLLCLFNLGQGIQKKLAGATGSKSGAKGWLVAIGGGILSHGPVYAWYPLLGELKSQGMRPALLAAFLYARSIKLPWLPVMVHYFGLSYTAIFTLYIILFSVLNGWLTERYLLSSAK